MVILARTYILLESKMEVGLVHKVDIDSEMQQAYLDYSMSVIVARALPDARDGLKPVHRRILYAMYDMGLRPDSGYKKSARIVGEVLGKYHPHGDMAVYESMARLAQDFSMRYLLVDGQGNFGSVDGDPPAAMRYTEARLTSPALDLLSDINKNTVNFIDNFDGTLTEPTVLPAAIPNLLVNGATGIAVGMATSIPPHNLGEIIDAVQYMLINWEKLDDVGVEELMHFVKGPDFPTGGVILHEESGDGLIAAYSTGRGRVTVQANAHMEEMERGRNRIIVSELPYMTNKASLIERIAELVREEKLEGIADLRDESDRQGMRIVIELSRTANPEAILRDLYKHTPMQVTFGINMLALVNGEPRMLSLKQALRVYVEHRLEIIRRRNEYDLEKTRQRAHILEGLRVALKHLDEIIALIRNSPDADIAKTRLIKRYKLSEIQAQSILDMPLKRLAALERKKIEEEYKETQVAIRELEALLKSSKKMRQVVGEELRLVKEDFSDRRKTHVVALEKGQTHVALLTTTDLMTEKSLWVSVTEEGIISRTLDEKQPRMNGRVTPAWLVQANNRDTLYLVNEQGEAVALPVHALPECESLTEGVQFHKVSAFHENDKLAAIFTLPAASRGDIPVEFSKWYVITGTRQGMVKKTALSELPGASAGTFTLVKVNEGDKIVGLRLTNGKNEILLITEKGMAIRFSEDEVRPMGLIAAGVSGLKLGKDDQVAGMDILPQSGDVFMIGVNGGVKRVSTSQFPKQGRYGQGVVAWPLSGKEKTVGIAIGKGTQRAIIHLSRLPPKVIRFDEIPLQGRTARGKSLSDIKPGENVIRLTVAWEVPKPGEGMKKRTDGSTNPQSQELMNKNVDEIKSSKRLSRKTPTINKLPTKATKQSTRTKNITTKTKPIPAQAKKTTPKTTKENIMSQEEAEPEQESNNPAETGQTNLASPPADQSRLHVTDLIDIAQTLLTSKEKPQDTTKPKEKPSAVSEIAGGLIKVVEEIAGKRKPTRRRKSIAKKETTSQRKTSAKSSEKTTKRKTSSEKPARKKVSAKTKSSSASKTSTSKKTPGKTTARKTTSSSAKKTSTTKRKTRGASLPVDATTPPKE
jgi:DNA gyrase subunit A